MATIFAGCADWTPFGQDNRVDLLAEVILDWANDDRLDLLTDWNIQHFKTTQIPEAFCEALLNKHKVRVEAKVEDERIWFRSR